MSIGEQKVINNLVKLGLYGDNKSGKVNIFGGKLIRTASEYSAKMFFSLDDYLSQIAPIYDGKKASFPILNDIGMKTGFFMIGNAMCSKEWEEFVLPIINNNDDWILGAIASINSMGLGKWKIKDFESNKRLVLNFYDSYEAEFYMQKYKEKPKVPVCTISAGIAASIMCLVYDSDIIHSKDKKIDLQLFYKCCKAEKSYKAKEVRCKAITKDHCEIIIER